MIYILYFVFRSSSLVATSFAVLYVFWLLSFFSFSHFFFFYFVLCTFRALYHSQRLCSATFERGAAGPSVSVIHTHVSYPPLLVAIFVFHFVFCILCCTFCIDCHHRHHDHWPATRFKIPWQPIKAFNCWLIGNQSAAPPYDCTCGQGNTDQFAQKYLVAAMELYFWTKNAFVIYHSAIFKNALQSPNQNRLFPIISNESSLLSSSSLQQYCEASLWFKMYCDAWQRRTEGQPCAFVHPSSLHWSWWCGWCGLSSWYWPSWFLGLVDTLCNVSKIVKGGQNTKKGPKAKNFIVHRFFEISCIYIGKYAQ